MVDKEVGMNLRPTGSGPLPMTENLLALVDSAAGIFLSE